MRLRMGGSIRSQKSAKFKAFEQYKWPWHIRRKATVQIVGRTIPKNEIPRKLKKFLKKKSRFKTVGPKNHVQN